VIISEALIADIPEMHRVRLSVRENVLTNPARVTHSDYERMIHNDGKGWICRVENLIRGFSFADAKTRNIWALFVEPGYERRGIGRQLHDSAVDWLFAQSPQIIWLTTRPGTRAEAFYRAAGWVAAGAEPNGEMRFEMRR
jgi:GNAT superfamily N-acetyltransferase